MGASSRTTGFDPQPTTDSHHPRTGTLGSLLARLCWLWLRPRSPWCVHYHPQARRPHICQNTQRQTSHNSLWVYRFASPSTMNRFVLNADFTSPGSSSAVWECRCADTGNLCVSFFYAHSVAWRLCTCPKYGMFTAGIGVDVFVLAQFRLALQVVEPFSSQPALWLSTSRNSISAFCNRRKHGFFAPCIVCATFCTRLCSCLNDARGSSILTMSGFFRKVGHLTCDLVLHWQ